MKTAQALGVMTYHPHLPLLAASLLRQHLISLAHLFTEGHILVCCLMPLCQATPTHLPHLGLEVRSHVAKVLVPPNGLF